MTHIVKAREHQLMIYINIIYSHVCRNWRLVQLIQIVYLHKLTRLLLVTVL